MQKLDPEPLIRAGCHLVLARRNKVPLSAGWQNKPPSPGGARRWAASGGLVGIVPGRSDLIVLDVDEGIEGCRLLFQEHPPLQVVKTPRGQHLYYARGRHTFYANRKWKAYGAEGDLRGDNGYVITWIPSLVEAAIEKMKVNPGEFLFPDDLFWPVVVPQSPEGVTA